MGVLGQAYSPRKGAADELGGSSVRWSLPWPKAEGEKGRRPSWPSHHHICIAAFETEAQPGRGGGGPWPLAFLHRSDLYAGWDPNSALTYTRTLRTDAGRDSCALCATTQELSPHHGWDRPWLLQRAPWMQTTRLFSVAFYKPSPICFSCGCLVFLKRMLRWLHIHHQPPRSLWAQPWLSHRGLEGSGPPNLLQAQWLTEICLMVLPKLWDDILQTWWAFVSLNPEITYKMGVWFSVFFFSGWG